MDVATRTPVTAEEWKGRKYGPALALLATLFFMWGFCTVLNDVLIPHLKAVFVMNYVQTMLIQFCFFGGYFLLSWPSAKLIEAVGYKMSIIVGLVVMAVGCLLFIPAAALPSYPLFLGALFVLAGGITLLQVAANPYVTVLGPPETGSSRLNLVQAFNSMGTFIAPFFGGMLILSRTTSGTAQAGAAVTYAERMQDAQAVQMPYFGIAMLLLAIAVAIYLFKLPKVSTHPETEDERRDNVWRHPMLLLGVIGIFLYVGAEVSIGSFIISYLSSPHVSTLTAAQAANLLPIYWGGTMVGRFIGAGLTRKVHPALLLGFNGVAAILVIVISMLASGPIAMWSILLVGLCNSIMFPTIFALAVKGLGPLTGRGSGWLIMAICGGGIIPLIQGALADRLGLTLSFIAPAVCYLYVLYFAYRAYEPRTPATAIREHS
jgi:MFS transporter, FHS family, L-fucose permease